MAARPSIPRPTRCCAGSTGLRRGGAGAPQLAERDHGGAARRPSCPTSRLASSPRISQQAALVGAGRARPGPRRGRATRSGWSAALAEIRGARSRRPRARPAGALRARRRVGFAGEEIVAWGGAGSTLAATIERLAEGAEIVTVIEGEGAPIPLDELPLELPDGVELEVQRGGQPHYWWLHCRAVNALLDEVLEAHGGLERWRAARTVRRGCARGGFLIRTRVRRRPLRRLPADGRGRATAGGDRSVPEGWTARRLRAGRARIETEPASWSPPGTIRERRSSSRAGLRRNLRWDALDSAYFAWLRDVELPDHDRSCSPATGRGGEAILATGRARAGGARGRFPDGARHALASARASTSTRRAACAATTTSPRWSGRAPGPRDYCADHARQVARLPDPPLGAPDSPGQPLAAASRPWSGSSSPSFTSTASSTGSGWRCT